MRADHDPLCPCVGGPAPRGAIYCRCELIAAVVERERHRWASQLIDCLFPDDDIVQALLDDDPTVAQRVREDGA